MRIYKRQAVRVVRIDIKGGKGNSRCITVADTTIEEAIMFVRSVFSKVMVNYNHPSTQPPPKIIVSCYEAEGDKKSKSKSLTLWGLKADEIKDRLINCLH